MAQRGLYLAIGDSITSGYGVGLDKSFPFLYYKFLKSGQPELQYINYGINGLTTEGLLKCLLNDSFLVNIIKSSSVISITIGSNDLLNLAKTMLIKSQWGITQPIIGENQIINLNLIVERIRLLNPLAKVQVATIYNPFPASQFAQWSGSAQLVINQFNNSLRLLAKKNYGFKVVPLDEIFKNNEQNLIGPDNLHPSLEGHKAIAFSFAIQ